MVDKEKTVEKSVAQKEEKSIARKEEKSIARKPNIFQRAVGAVRQYFKETTGELRKVSWPTRKEATYLTGVVIVVTVVMSTYLGLLDFIFTRLIALLFTRSAG